MRTKDRATEFTNVRDNKAGTGSYMRTGLRDATECKYLVPSSVQLMNWEDFGSLIILCTYVMRGQQVKEEWTESSEDMYN